MLKENLIRILETSFKEHWNMQALSDYFKEDRYTYGEVAREIARLHILFKRLRIKKGDKIAIIGRNNTHWCISCLSIITYGAVVVPILQDFNANDVQHILNHSDSIMLFAGSVYWESIDVNQIKSVRSVFSLEDFKLLYERTGNIVGRFVHEEWNTLMKRRYPRGFSTKDVKYAKVTNDKLAILNYTSGTTGYSKGVMLSINNLTGNILFGQKWDFYFAGARSLSFLPLAHAYGCTFDFLLPLTQGSSVTLLGKIPSPKILMEAFKKVKPNLILSVPLILEKIYRKQIAPLMEKKSMKILSKMPYLRRKVYEKIRNGLVDAMGGEFSQFIVGGAPLNKEVERFIKKIKFPYTIGYGMTECAPLIAFAPWNEFKEGSCGRVLEGLMEAKIDSENPQKVAGEILVRGENVMMGYYKNSEATQKVLVDGWLHTGDMGVMDADGNLYIRGRCKDMILGANGQNIYPEEIESKLNNLPCVMESLVVKRGDRLVALVYPNYDEVDQYGVRNAGLEELMENNRKTLNTLVAPYEAVQKIILRTDEFEKTPKKNIKRYLYAIDEQ